MKRAQDKTKGNIIIFTILGIYMFLGNIANYTIYSTISIGILVIAGGVYILKNKKIYLNIYFWLYIVFLIYQLLLVVTGVVTDSRTTLSTIQTMSINFIVLLVIYNVLVLTKDIKLFIRVFIITATLSLLTIMFLLRGNLFTGRLAHAYGEDSVSYYLFGKPVAMSSNGIAFTCAIAVLFSIYIYYKERKIKCIFISLYLMFGIILTGSRKGILVVAFYIAMIINLIYKNKLGKKILIFLGGFILVWLAITKIPVFYNIIGERLIELIKKFLGLATNEGSIVARERYKSYALQWISERFWLGRGAGTFKATYGNVTESNYLEMMVSGGIIGTVLYYLYVFPAIYRYIKTKNKNDFLRLFSIVLVSIFLIEYGSVTYLARNYLIFIVAYFAYLKILRNDFYKQELEGEKNVGII